LRPYITIALAVIAVAVIPGAGPGAAAQSTHLGQILDKLDPLVSHNSQGYLGVLVTDVDNDSASKLKLKEVRGALITLIDHDAPAGQIGLHINDVVVELNGQRIEGAEQFGRMLREFPAGRKVTLLISRDGNPQTIEVQLCDHKVMAQDVWNRLNHQGDQGDGSGSAPTRGIFNGNGDAGTPGFHNPFFGSSLNVGAMVEPLAPQTAEFLGIQNGVLVKQVARKSEAAAAGLKAHDVILKVGNEAIITTADWDRALRSNQNKPVQVTILRDGKQQVLNLQVDSKHNKSELDYQDVFPGLLPDGPCPLMAALDPAWAVDAQQLSERLRDEAEYFRRNFNPDDFKVDQKQVDELKKQMEQFRQNFNTDAFRIDPKQIQELRRQMEKMRKSMPEWFNKKQMEQFRRDMEQMRQELGQLV
jgi:membrane-associated protease RseP (regulator of RpoE activity)